MSCQCCENRKKGSQVANFKCLDCISWSVLRHNPNRELAKRELSQLIGFEKHHGFTKEQILGSLKK